MKKFTSAIAFLLLWFSIHEALIILDGLNDEVVKSDYAVIFGNKVNEDGTLSTRLKSRVDKGLELYKDSVVSKIFVSGGLGKEGFYEGTEMQKYLLTKGIPVKDIIIDNEGNNTGLTAKNFVAKEGKTASIIVVSQFYHISRSKLAFRQVGIKNIAGVHSDYFELRDVYSLFREFLGYYKYWLF